MALLVTRAQRLWRWDMTVGVAGVAVLLALLFAERHVSVVGSATIVGMLCYAMHLWEVRRRTVTFVDDLDPVQKQDFQALDRAVRLLTVANQLWAIVGLQAVTGSAVRKGNAGANQNLTRVPLELVSKEPRWVETTIPVASLRTQPWHVTFLPQGLLIVTGGTAAFAPYNRISVHGQPTRFVEETPPRDASVVATTWQFVNRDGSPDRRYSANRQLTVCEYGQVEIKSPELAVIFHVSNTSIARSFVDEFVRILAAIRTRP